MDVTAASKSTRGACAACGDSPVMHLPTYITTSVEAWMADHVPNGIWARWYERVADRFEGVADAIFAVLANFAIQLGLVRTSTDPEKACTYRSQVIWEEAIRRGICMEQLIFLGTPTEIYRAQLPRGWLYFQSIPIPAPLARTRFKDIDDKLHVKRFLSEHGLNMSTAHCSHDLSHARRMFDALQKPVVVKPRIGSRARHTTTNIWTIEEFDAAFALAQQLCAYVLIEEHYGGAVSRATVVSGTLRGFLQMFPARVTGDGVCTIAQLIDRKNASRPERIAAVTLDAEHISYLSRSNLTPESVLDAGRTIDLSRRTGRFEGGATHEIRDMVHPVLREYVERAARILGAPIVGFDLIIPDPTQHPDTQRWGIIEANSLPYIDLHYFPLEGNPSRIAEHVWDWWHAPLSSSVHSTPIDELRGNVTMDV